MNFGLQERKQCHMSTRFLKINHSCKYLFILTQFEKNDNPRHCAFFFFFTVHSVVAVALVKDRRNKRYLIRYHHRELNQSYSIDSAVNLYDDDDDDGNLL